MPREFPVGTIRDWQSGTVIKAHTPLPPYSDGWIPLIEHKEFSDLAKTADELARVICRYQTPINGERVLDHVIEEFGKKEGLSAFFTPGNFKQYQGMYGAGRYSFRNEFNRMLMQQRMRLHEEMCVALVQANDDKGGDAHNDKLTQEEKAQIRAQVRAEFKEEPSVLNRARAEKLVELVRIAKRQVEEGTDFRDPEKKTLYVQFLKLLYSLTEDCGSFKVKRAVYKEALQVLVDNFSDNWGVLDTGISLLNKKFGEYMRTCEKHIRQECLEEQMRMFGTSIYAEPDEFYNNIYQTLESKKRWAFLDEYIDKKVGFERRWWGDSTTDYFKIKKVNDTYYVCKEGKWIKLEELLENYRIAPAYNEFDMGFKDLIRDRFMHRYSKVVEGEWKPEHLPALHNLENLLLELPEGHFQTNDQLEYVTNKDYKGGSHGGYAWYAPTERRINLSASCVERGSVWGVLEDPTEFKSVLLHEIGHAVEAKLGGRKNYNFRKFAVYGGWSFAQPEFRYNQRATGDQSRIPRKGSYSGNKLLTDYSYTSPEEAFAEYYSFYNLNKDAIDRFLETKDRHHLREHQFKRYSSESLQDKVATLGNYNHVKSLEEIKSQLDTYHEILNVMSERGREINVKLVDPWELTPSKESKERYDPDITRNLLHNTGLTPNDFSAVITVREEGAKHTVISGYTLVQVAKYRDVSLRTVEISKEFYQSLRDTGLSDQQIEDCVVYSLSGTTLPKATSRREAETMYGLIYRDKIIPEDVIAENTEALRMIKRICELPELQKALSETFDVFAFKNE